MNDIGIVSNDIQVGLMDGLVLHALSLSVIVFGDFVQGISFFHLMASVVSLFGIADVGFDILWFSTANFLDLVPDQILFIRGYHGAFDGQFTFAFLHIAIANL